MKQEIIEEMARIIAFDLCPNRSVHAKWGEEAQCYSDNNFAECTKIKNVVDKLYNAGYRKIPENAVVLTREEYEELQTGQDFNYGYHNGETNMTAYYENIRLPEVRKETAEKFAERLKEYSITEYKEFGALRFYKISYPQLDELVEEMTK